MILCFGEHYKKVIYKGEEGEGGGVEVEFFCSNLFQLNGNCIKIYLPSNPPLMDLYLFSLI